MTRGHRAAHHPPHVYARQFRKGHPAPVSPLSNLDAGMKSGVPWQVKVRPEARETAREAARRAGMSVEEWLDTVIIEASTTGTEPVATAPHGHPHEPDERADWDREPPAPRKFAEHDDRPQAPIRDERPQPTARDHP